MSFFATQQQLEDRLKEIKKTKRRITNLTAMKNHPIIEPFGKVYIKKSTGEKTFIPLDILLGLFSPSEIVSRVNTTLTSTQGYLTFLETGTMIDNNPPPDPGGDIIYIPSP